jgi:hypothetical protein
MNVFPEMTAPERLSSPEKQAQGDPSVSQSKKNGMSALGNGQIRNP